MEPGYPPELHLIFTLQRSVSLEDIDASETVSLVDIVASMALYPTQVLGLSQALSPNLQISPNLDLGALPPPPNPLSVIRGTWQI